MRPVAAPHAALGIGLGVRAGDRVEVNVLSESRGARIDVSDRGPGVPEDAKKPDTVLSRLGTFLNEDLSDAKQALAQATSGIHVWRSRKRSSGNRVRSFTLE